MASTISSKLLILLQPNLMLQCIVINQCVSWKDWLAVFKVKVTMIVNTCWSGLYFPHHWFLYLCKQTRCLGVLLLINTLSASKMGTWLLYTDNNIDLKYLGIQYGCLAMQGDKLYQHCFQSAAYVFIYQMRDRILYSTKTSAYVPCWKMGVWCYRLEWVSS